MWHHIMDPSPFPWIDVFIILALIALNGVFAMSELAIVSSRPARLQAMAAHHQKHIEELRREQDPRPRPGCPSC